MKHFLPPATILFLALWLVLLVGGRSRFFQDAGTFWHTVVGSEILTTRGFFDTDEYTFTFNGKTWIPHQWLGEVVMSLTHGIAKLDSLLLLTASLLAGLYAWLGARLMRAGLHWSVAGVLVALAVAASAGHFHVRPHLATIVCFAVTMALLTDYGAGRVGIGRLVWLIPMFLIWTNTHGGMLGGLATFALAIGGWVIAWRIGWDSPLWSWKDVGYLALIFLGCAATAFVNPYGIRLPQTWLEIYDSKILPQIIKEHSRIDLTEWGGWMIALFAVCLLVMLSGLREKPRVMWVIALIWMGMAFLRVRHAPLFAAAGLVVLADFFPRTRWAERLVKSGSDWFTREPKPGSRLAWVVPTAAVLFAFAVQALHLPIPVIGQGWAKLDPTVWPTQLEGELRIIDEELPNEVRVFNEYTYGGFLIYHTQKFRVFVDDRCELFGDDWLADFVAADSFDTAGHMEMWQGRYGPFDYALTATDSGFDRYFQQSPRWQSIKRTETATLWQRTAPAP